MGKKACPPYLANLMDTSIGNGTTGSNAVAVDYPKHLAYDLPALSFAAGGTKIGRSPEKQAFDMNSEMAYGWPKERLQLTKVIKWRHSDFKDVAYRYTYKLFDSFVSEGALNETK